MENESRLSASLEDYLEAILGIVAKKQAARAKDIADQLKVRASSVTGALKLLAEKELINYAPYDIITLTPEGERIARDVARRHEVLKTFFTDILCVDAAEAEDGACKMEHAVPPKIIKRLIQFADFMQQCPRAGSRWIEEFESFCSTGSIRDTCDDCITDCLHQYRNNSSS